MATNIKGVIYGWQVAAKGMIKQKNGAICSMEGLGSNNMTQTKTILYGTTKHVQHQRQCLYCMVYEYKIHGKICFCTHYKKKTYKEDESHMKHKWKKEEKELYSPSTMPTIINVRKQKYFMISGKGNPNGEEFSEKIGVLYSLAYAVRMMPKGGYTPDGYFEYTVYPLEGVWDLTENGKNSDTFNKEELLYTIMIRQPDFVTEQVAKRAFEIVQKKKPHPFLSDAKFAEMEDGTCVQILHIGPFDDEPQSFAKIKDFINQNGLKREILTHREIYLSDFRKTEQQKLKTILRYFVKKL